MIMIVAYTKFVKMKFVDIKNVKAVLTVKKIRNAVKLTTLVFVYHDHHVLVRIAARSVLRISIVKNMERYAS